MVDLLISIHKCTLVTVHLVPVKIFFSLCLSPRLSAHIRWALKKLQFIKVPHRKGNSMSVQGDLTLPRVQIQLSHHGKR